MIYILLITLVTVLWIFDWFNKRKFLPMSNIPGPKPLPFLGNILEFGFNPVDKLKNIHRINNTYGPLSKVWIGPINLYLLAADPEFCEYLLSSPKYIKKAAHYDNLNSWLGNSLLLSSGSYWQKRRKIITPAFHFKILDEFVSIFNKESNKLVQRLAKNIGQKECNVYPYVTACTLDIICETAMGASVKAQDNFDNEYVRAVKTMCNVFIERIFSSWKQFDVLFQFSSSYKTQTEALKIIHGFTNSVIEQRREKLLNNNNSLTDINTETGIKKKMAFLDVLLQATVDGKPLSDVDIREEVDTFMFGGHDTTASLIAFTMYELAKNPNVQDKVFTEIREIYGDDKNFEPKLQDFNDMKYTESVLKEAMRLYPPVPYIGRKLEEDINFKGTTLPKDLSIVVFIYGMQRRPDLFPDPEKFNPDRFLIKNTNNNPFSYIPFSAGPRNCIGQKFAMYAAKSTISKIIMNFELSPADSKYDIVLSGEVVLKSANGVHVQLKQRQI